MIVFVFKNSANQEKDRKVLDSDWLFQILHENKKIPWKLKSFCKTIEI
jgi:hypothetical protein